MAVIRDMGLEGVGKAMSLINEEGWGFTEDEVARIVKLDPDGSFLCYEGEQLLGVVTSAAYGRTGAVGHLVVAKEARRRKVGQSLLERVLEHCRLRGCDSVILFATDQGMKLYQRLGFEIKQEAFCYHSCVRAKDLVNAENPCRPLRSTDLDDIARLDERLFGDDRSKLMRFLVDEFPEHAYVLRRDGRLIGFAMGQRTANGSNIGPWLCVSDANDARLLFQAVTRSLGPGDIYVCGFRGNKVAIDILEALEPIRAWDVKLMVRGKPRYPIGVNNIQSVVSFEFG